MKADLLHQTDAPPDGTTGGWVEDQDPLTGEIVREWILGDVPGTLDVETFTTICEVMPLVGNTVRFGGDVEIFAANYRDNVYALMNFPTNVIITKRDRVTNIRNRDNEVLWQELEMDKVDNKYRATVFNVIGIRPLLGPFGQHIGNEALLERAEIQT